MGGIFWEHHWSWEKIQVLFYLELWFDDFASEQNMVGYHPIPLSFFCPRNLTVAKLENFYMFCEFLEEICIRWIWGNVKGL